MNSFKLSVLLASFSIIPTGAVQASLATIDQNAVVAPQQTTVSGLVATFIGRIEARDMAKLEAPMILENDWSAGGDHTVIEVPNGALSLGGSVEYHFVVQSSGNYFFQGRTKAITANDDSFCVKIYDEVTLANVVTGSGGGGCGAGKIYWGIPISATWNVSNLTDNYSSIVVALPLVGGRVYNITIIKREDGTKLDWLELYQM